jgi:hypothetical protein
MRSLIPILLFTTATLSLALDSLYDNHSLEKSNVSRTLKSKTGKQCKSSKSPGKGRYTKSSKGTKAKSSKIAKSSKMPKGGKGSKSSKMPKSGKGSKSSKMPKSGKGSKSSKMPKNGKGSSKMPKGGKGSSKMPKGGKSSKSSKMPKSGKGHYYDCDDSSPTTRPVPPPSRKPSTPAPTLEPTVVVPPSDPCDSEKGRKRDIEAVVESISGTNLSADQQDALDWLLDGETNACEGTVGITQRYSLGVFYYSTQGDEWVENTNWLDSDIDECDWFGVDCDGDDNVTILALGM